MWDVVTLIWNSITQVTGVQWVLFLSGLAIPPLTYLCNKLIIFFQKRKMHLLYERDWHVYHWTRDDYTPIFRHEIWKIKRGFLNPIKVITLDNERKDLMYSGEVEFEGGYVVITLKSISHRDETIHVRVQPEPIPGHNIQGMMMRGLYIDHDFDKEIFCAVFLGMENEISTEEAKKSIETLTAWSEKESSLRLNKIPVRS